MGPYLQNKEDGITGKLAQPSNAGLLTPSSNLLKHTEVSTSFQKDSSSRHLWPDFSSQRSASLNPNQTSPPGRISQHLSSTHLNVNPKKTWICEKHQTKVVLLHASVRSERLTPDSPQFLEILIKKATAWRISQYPIFTKSINSCATACFT